MPVRMFSIGAAPTGRIGSSVGSHAALRRHAAAPEKSASERFKAEQGKDLVVYFSFED
jgi:hypothetical protein